MYTDDMYRRLWKSIQEQIKFDSVIVPLTDEEVAEIEASYVPVELSPEEEQRSREWFEEFLKEIVKGGK